MDTATFEFQGRQIEVSRIGRRWLLRSQNTKIEHRLLDEALDQLLGPTNWRNDPSRENLMLAILLWAMQEH